MDKDTAKTEKERIESQSKRYLEDLLREGARRMLQSAIENEVSEYIDRHTFYLTPEGHRQVVRNGHLPERTIQTGIGSVPVRQPRIRDRRSEHRFTSAILPPFMRRVPSVEALIPALYLRGISTGNFADALSAILGPNAPGLSATNIVRLKAEWKQEYESWSNRDLTSKHYVYWWCDGIYFNVRLTPERPCMLVIIGVREDGVKELVAVYDGQRESKLSWLEVLRDLKFRGLKDGPKLAIGDGALGFWAAMEEEYPAACEQRCWVHKTANILDKMPKSVQPHAKILIQEMYLAPSLKVALKAYDRFINEYEAKYEKAVACLKKDRDVLFTFYQFPAVHWQSIRTTNPIESAFATVRHRTRQTKGCGSRLATIMMVFKLVEQAERNWRKLRGYRMIPLVISNVIFIDGEIKKAA